MGEIGLPRREFLYDITFWEARRIIRGYRRRRILQYQLQRLNVWASAFCMGNPNNVQPHELIKLYFDDDEGQDAPPIDEDDIKELIAEMDAINATIGKP